MNCFSMQQLAIQTLPESSFLLYRAARLSREVLIAGLEEIVRQLGGEPSLIIKRQIGHACSHGSSGAFVILSSGGILKRHGHSFVAMLG
jgi:hypothetical protein